MKQCIQIARQAGQVILDTSLSTDLCIQKKEDKTPVTLADLRAHDFIFDALSTLTPMIPIISEEAQAPLFSLRSTWTSCWLVDPLDGTRGFIDGSGEYTVNIALIENYQAVLGVIYAPASNRLYYASKNQGAFICVDNETRPIHVHPYNKDRPLVIAVSQYHNSEWCTQALKDNADYTLLRMNSSLKMGFIAQGLADFYPRLGPTSEWDTAAGQCIIEEAGGLLIDLTGEPLRYNARDTLINPGFAVIGDSVQRDYFLGLIRDFDKLRRER